MADGRSSGRTAAKRRAAAARSARLARLRRYLLIGTVVVIAAVAIGIWRFDLDDTIQELTLPLKHEDVIREVALPMGLVDIKVCAVDDTWSGLKLVVRKELR
jgi:hypothetical protein